MQLECFHYYYFCHIYLPNINNNIKSLVCTELQHTKLLLSCVQEKKLRLDICRTSLCLSVLVLCIGDDEILF